MSLIPYITGINPYPILYPLIPLSPFATVIRHRHLQKILQKFFYINSKSTHSSNLFYISRLQKILVQKFLVKPRL